MIPLNAIKNKREGTSQLLSLTLKTPESAADAAVVASMLRAIVVLIEETQVELKIEGEFSIRVNPFKEGSLEIPVQVYLAGVAASLFTFNPGLDKLMVTIKSFFELKKSFKGESPSENALQDNVIVGNITILGSNNIINITQQPRVVDTFNQAAQDLEKDESLTGMKLINKQTGEEIVNLTREEFKYLGSLGSGQPEVVPHDRVRTVTTLLTIHSPVLQGAAKWKFLYEGKQISASIKDEIFLEKVGNGAEAFRNGDRLKVELEIGEKYVTSVQDHERSGQYTIARVLQHIQRLNSSKQLLPEQPDKPL